jgi:hypothetical protein
MVRGRGAESARGSVLVDFRKETISFFSSIVIYTYSTYYQIRGKKRMFKPFGKKVRSTSIRALHEPTEDRLEKMVGFPKGPKKLRPVKFPGACKRRR